ncbi:hypothetical protein MRX96_055027 [Rhipicephalus microplus]
MFAAWEIYWLLKECELTFSKVHEDPLKERLIQKDAQYSTAFMEPRLDSAVLYFGTISYQTSPPLKCYHSGGVFESEFLASDAGTSASGAETESNNGCLLESLCRVDFCTGAPVCRLLGLVQGRLVGYGQTFTQGVTQTPGYTNAVSMVSPAQPSPMYAAPAGGFMMAQPRGMMYGPPPAPPFGGPMPPPRPLQGQFGPPPFAPPQQLPPFPPPPFGRSGIVVRPITNDAIDTHGE